MANTKTNILKLTLATDLTTLFTDWITILNNNSVIIDDEAGTVRNAIASANQQIQEIITNLLNYYTKAQVDELIQSIARLEIKLVDSVEEVTEAGYIYLVPKESTEQKDVFDEYIFYDGKPELIGTTQIDLSNYYTKDEIDDLLENKADVDTVYTKTEVYNKTEIDETVEDITESIPEIEANPENPEELESLNTLRINDSYFRIDSVAPGKAASINYIAYLMSFHDTAIPADSKLDTLIGEIDDEDRDLIMTYNVINNS